MSAYLQISRNKSPLATKLLPRKKKKKKNIQGPVKLSDIPSHRLVRHCALSSIPRLRKEQRHQDMKAFKLATALQTFC